MFLFLLCFVTLFEVTKKTIPKGTNMIPITKKVIMTGFGVKIGCQAFRFCCLNRVTSCFGWWLQSWSMNTNIMVASTKNKNNMKKNKVSFVQKKPAGILELALLLFETFEGLMLVCSVSIILHKVFGFCSFATLSDRFYCFSRYSILIVSRYL